LQKGGLFIIGTPNKELTLAYGGQWNPAHSQEFSTTELYTLLSGRFSSVNMLGQYIKNETKRSYILKNVHFNHSEQLSRLNNRTNPNGLKAILKHSLPENIFLKLRAAYRAWGNLPIFLAKLKHDESVMNHFTEDDFGITTSLDKSFGLLAICKK